MSELCKSLGAVAALAVAAAPAVAGPVTITNQTREIEAYAAGAGRQERSALAAGDFGEWRVGVSAGILEPPGWDLDAAASHHSILTPDVISITGALSANRRAGVIPDDVASSNTAMILSLVVTSSTAYVFDADLGPRSTRSLQRMMRLSRIGGGTVFEYNAGFGPGQPVVSGVLVPGDYRFEVIYGAAADRVAASDSAAFRATLTVPAPGTLGLLLFAAPRRRR